MCRLQWFPQLYIALSVLVLWVLRLFFVCFIYLFYFIFISRATVSAVLQPCRTCYMLSVLLARCVLYVFLANKRRRTIQELQKNTTTTQKDRHDVSRGFVFFLLCNVSLIVVFGLNATIISSFVMMMMMMMMKNNTHKQLHKNII